MSLFGSDDSDDEADEDQEVEVAEEPYTEEDLNEEIEEVNETAEAAGISAGKMMTKSIAGLLGAFGKFLLSIFTGLMKPLPVIKNKVWKKLLGVSLKQYHRASGGDRLGLEVQPSGKMDLTPVKYRGPDQCDDDEQPGWKAKGRDKVWRPTTMGQDGYRLAKVPVVPLDSDSWKSTNVLESRVAEAVDQGETRPLYSVEEAHLTAEMDYGAGANGTAVADGGANLSFEPRTSPIFEDTIIDLGSDDYDGQAVSWEKSKELMLETVSTEEMDLHERRGELAGKAGQDRKSFVIKVMLIGAGLAALGLVGEELMAFFIGGGGGGDSGGGGGGGTPLTMFAPKATLGNLIGW